VTSPCMWGSESNSDVCFIEGPGVWMVSQEGYKDKSRSEKNEEDQESFIRLVQL